MMPSVFNKFAINGQKGIVFFFSDHLFKHTRYEARFIWSEMYGLVFIVCEGEKSHVGQNDAWVVVSPFFLYLDPGFSCNVTTEQLIETQLSYVKDISSKDERSVFV